MVDQNKSVVSNPKPDGSTEWWELTDEWRLLRTDPASSTMATDVEVAAAIETHSGLATAHPTHGDINFTGTISADGYAGHSERVTVGDKLLTFKEGICILVEDA